MTYLCSNFRIGDAALEGDNKLSLLRTFSDWLEKWQALQCRN